MISSIQDELNTSTPLADDRDPVAEAARLIDVMHQRTRELHLARRTRESWSEVWRRRDDEARARRALHRHLRQHFYTTSEVARRFGIPERHVQLMATRGFRVHCSSTGLFLLLGLTAVRYGGYRFPKTEIDLVLGAPHDHIG